MSTSSVRLDIQLEIGADASRLGAGLVARPIDDRDLAHGSLRNRSLPVAVAKFADQIARALEAGRSPPTLDRS